MISKKLGVLLIFTFLASSIFGAVNVMGIYIEPIDPIEPPPTPPPTQTISGYVKESGTSAPIYNARVVLYGWDFVIDMYEFVQVGVRYTNTYGYYSFTGVTADAPYSLLVTKSGYAGYSGAYRSPVYLRKLDSVIRITGTVLDDETIDNIQRINADPLSLDITPEGLTGYNYVITGTTVYVRIYDYTGTAIKTVTCNPSTGAYDTGSFSIKNGNIRIRAYTTSSKPYTPKDIYTTISSSTTLTGQNFYLERNLGTVSVYGDAEGIDRVTNFKIKPDVMTIDPSLSYLNYPDFLEFDFYTKNAPSIVYNPFDSRYTDYWLSTNYLVQTYNRPAFLADTWYTIQNARVSLYAYNHWTTDESFMSLAGIWYEDESYGSGQQFQWTYTAQLGWDPTPGGLSGQIQASVTSTPPSSVDVDPYVTGDEVNSWKRLGYVDIDYSNDWTSVSKDLTVNWQVQLDNGEYSGELWTLKQSGAHITLKVVYEFDINIHRTIYGVFNWWESYPAHLTIEQNIGDNQLSYPTYTFDYDPYFSYSYEAGSQSGRDYWMNLLAGEAGLLPV
ncbi:MAG: carboxypeptidase regulatory-like domain-containing protein [Candidatus Heimdallarchaeota archaeon]|nr:carboxypeptidase regulatory-like domain-containing protein [Candidatus Heimdallarchaeota archaeon]